MSDFKIACPNCGQHLALEEAWRGRTLQCPSCQAEVSVPNVEPAPRSPTALARATPDAPQSNRPQPTAVPRVGGPAQRGPLCPLAPIALLLVVATPVVAFIHTMLFPRFLVIPVAPACLLAGLICGHVALRRIRRSSLQGTAWAVVGLSLGYALLLGTAVLVTSIVGLNKGWFHGSQPLDRRAELFRRPMPGRITPGPGGTRPAPNPNLPALQPGHSLRAGPNAAAIPVTNTVTGTLAGQPFRCDRARWLGSVLELNQGTDFIAETCVTIFTMSGTPDGRTFAVPNAAGGPTPQVNVRWRDNGRTRLSPGRDGVKLRLEFGQRSGNLLPGKIQLEITADPATRLSGNFTAELR